MRYDLNLLPIFVALMEERSVTRAAERLGMTQPALSNALARLRLMLQDQLFIRERYGIQPTPIALELAPSIVEALARLDDAVLGQQEFDPATAERLLTIAPNGYVEFVLVPAVVARLQQAAPGIKLRLAPWQRSGGNGRRLRHDGVGARPRRRSARQSRRPACDGRGAGLRGAGRSS